MELTDLSQIATFLAQYRDFNEARHHAHFAQFRAGFDRLQRELVPFQAQAAAARRRAAHMFNVFRMLGVSFHEVSTRSALLADRLHD